VIAEKLGIFMDERARRVETARIYDERLSGVVKTQIGLPGDESGHGLYTVRVANRTDVRAKLSEQGIPSGIYYDMAIHQMPAFAHYTPEGGLPECEKAAEEALSLPMHPYLSEAQIHRICDALIDVL
jgi:dTDP-4-amino-4,6-dideoxygalactose transaminase